MATCETEMMMKKIQDTTAFFVLRHHMYLHHSRSVHRTGWILYVENCASSVFLSLPNRFPAALQHPDVGPQHFARSPSLSLSIRLNTKSSVTQHKFCRLPFSAPLFHLAAPSVLWSTILTKTLILSIEIFFSKILFTFIISSIFSPLLVNNMEFLSTWRVPVFPLPVPNRVRRSCACVRDSEAGAPVTEAELRGGPGPGGERGATWARSVWDIRRTAEASGSSPERRSQMAGCRDHRCLRGHRDPRHASCSWAWLAAAPDWAGWRCRWRPPRCCAHAWAEAKRILGGGTGRCSHCYRKGGGGRVLGAGGTSLPLRSAS